MTYTEEKAFVTEKCSKLGIELPKWFLPIGKRVLVARLPTRNRTEGGLWLADVDTELPLFGVLVAAGLEARDILDTGLIEIGDVVKFGKYEGSEDEINRDAFGKGKMILILPVEALSGSFEAEKRAEEHDIEIQENGDGTQSRVWVPRKNKSRKKAS